MNEENAPCRVCGQPLGPIELEIHFDCNKCATCEQGPLAQSIISNWLAGTGTREHTGCRDKRLEAEILAKEVTVSQAHLDYLNKIRLTLWANDDLDIEGNSREAERAYRELKVHEMPLEVLYKFLSKLTTLAACTSIAIATTKDKQLKKATNDYREKTQYEKEQERLKTRTEETRKIQLQKEREDPALRTRRKAIEGLMSAFSMTREAAESMIAEREKK